MGRRVLVERLDTYYHHLKVPHARARGRDLDSGDPVDVWLDEETSAHVFALDSSGSASEPLILEDVPDDWCRPPGP